MYKLKFKVRINSTYNNKEDLYMKSIGSFMAIAGLISIALFFFGYELKILMWIDNWGETVGWLIRGGLVVIGAAIWFFSPEPEES